MTQRHPLLDTQVPSPVQRLHSLLRYFFDGHKAPIMATAMRVLLDPAQQMPEINLAGARGQMFSVAPVAVGEPDLSYIAQHLPTASRHTRHG
jgi:hypothetical protein